MGILKLNQLVSSQRQRRRRRRRRDRQIQARGGSTSSRVERKCSPCQNDDNSLDGKIKGYSGPDLPEDIWCYICSLMPMRDAAQAASVSRAFLSSWRCHPNLTFSEETLGLSGDACRGVKKSKYFASTVCHILKKHSGIGLKTFKLDNASLYNTYKIRHGDLENWLQIAVKPGIEELDLLLYQRSAIYNFPCSLLSDGGGESLRCLRLAGCNFHPTVGLDCLTSLTRLELCAMYIAGDELESTFQCFCFGAVGTQALQWNRLPENTMPSAA